MAITQSTNLKSNTGFNKNAQLLLRSSAKAVINAPIDKIDIPEWLFALTDEEYQQCSKAHIAAGATRTPDGSKRIEINVEQVGPGLMVQHWTEDIAEKQHCRLVSLSDMFVQQERTKMQLTWDTSVRPLSENSCEFTDTISVFETDEYLAFVKKSGASPEQMRDETQRALDAHNAEGNTQFRQEHREESLIDCRQSRVISMRKKRHSSSQLRQSERRSWLISAGHTSGPGSISPGVALQTCYSEEFP